MKNKLYLGYCFQYLPLALSILAIFLALMATMGEALANIPRLPGSDEMDKLSAAGTLLRLVDSFIFKFGARMMAGVAVLAAGWNLKEQRFGLMFTCLIAAVVLGTAPMWVKNIFDFGGGSLFSSLITLGDCFA